jgi:hypothetical protein
LQLRLIFATVLPDFRKWRGGFRPIIHWLVKKELAMLRRYYLVLTIVIGFFIAGHAYGSIQGTETPIKEVEISKDTCSVFNKFIMFFVNAKAGPEAEAKIFVRKRANKEDFNCNLSKKEDWMTINYGISNQFYGIFDRFLFLDAGTGPDVRNLTIYDLAKRKKVYSVDYYEDTLSIEDNGLIFHKDLELRYKRPCPDAKKFGAVDYGFEQNTRLDLYSLDEKPIGKIECYPRQ